MEKKCSSPGDLPNPGIKLRSPTLQVDCLRAEPQGKPLCQGLVNCKCIDLFQSVYAFPLVHMSGSMPRSCFFDYYTFVVGFEIESMISLGLFFLLRIDWLLAI